MNVIYESVDTMWVTPWNNTEIILEIITQDKTYVFIEAHLKTLMLSWCKEIKIKTF